MTEKKVKLPLHIFSIGYKKYIRMYDEKIFRTKINVLQIKLERHSFPSLEKRKHYFIGSLVYVHTDTK